MVLRSRQSNVAGGGAVRSQKHIKGGRGAHHDDMHMESGTAYGQGLSSSSLRVARALHFPSGSAVRWYLVGFGAKRAVLGKRKRAFDGRPYAGVLLCHAIGCFCCLCLFLATAGMNFQRGHMGPDPYGTAKRQLANELTFSDWSRPTNRKLRCSCLAGGLGHRYPCEVRYKR